MDPNDIQILQMNREAFDRWVAVDERLETGQSGSIDETVRLFSSPSLLN